MIPTIDPAIHAERRQRLLAALPEGAIVVLRSAPMAVRSRDTEFPYRAENDLLYLTGFPEPETVAVLDRDCEPHFQLFVQPRDLERETWTGRRLGPEGACERFGADAADTTDAFLEAFRKRIDDCTHLYFDLGRDEAFNALMLGEFRRSLGTRDRSGKPPLALLAASDPIHEMRLRKDPSELALMRRAAAITAEAHTAARQATRPGAFEYEIEATLNGLFRRQGGSGPAYGSIVASGANGTILHYVENDRCMEAGDLMLIDAGAEYGHYCADVTRTFPVDGKFRDEQRLVYDIVLAAQARAIAAIAPGARFDDVHDAALHTLVDGLCDLGVLQESAAQAIETESYRPYYMHRTSHWLGMDVHDVGRYREPDGASRTLEPGMVLTVEPGLYFGNGTSSERFAGIGIRIEDDVLVTEDGHEVLTAAIPKDP